MVHFQDSILKHLHHHTLFKMFYDEILEVHCAWILSCFSLGACVWHINWVIFLSFQLSSPFFSIALQMWLGLPHLSIISLPWCVCTHPINPTGIHFLCCTHANKCIGTHDVVFDIFAIIAQDVDFHLGWEQLHAFPLTTFSSSCWWVNIVLTLVDIVITNPMCVDLFPWSYTTQGFATSNAI
jgi:hypothetical protein